MADNLARDYDEMDNQPNTGQNFSDEDEVVEEVVETPTNYNRQPIRSAANDDRPLRPRTTQNVSRAGAQVAGTGAQVAGTATQVTGKAVGATGKGVSTAGRGAMSAGAAMSATGVGAIAGVPLMVAGAGATAVGAGVQVAGKGVEATGRGVKNAGKVAKKAGRRDKRTQRPTVSGGFKTKKSLQARTKDKAQRSLSGNEFYSSEGGAVGITAALTAPLSMARKMSNATKVSYAIAGHMFERMVFWEFVLPAAIFVSIFLFGLNVMSAGMFVDYEAVTKTIVEEVTGSETAGEIAEKIVSVYTGLMEFLKGALFPSYGPAMALWGISMVITGIVFLMAGFFYLFVGKPITSSISRFLVTITCVAGALLPFMNIFPWFVAWVVYMYWVKN